MRFFLSIPFHYQKKGKKTEIEGYPEAPMLPAWRVVNQAGGLA